VLEEKQSRVAEVVLSSVPSDTLLFGKVLGIGAVGFTQLAIWTAMSMLILWVRAPLLAAIGISTTRFALPDLTLMLAVVILLSFVLGFLFYAALFAAVGAIVNTEQDAQQAQLPVVLLLVISLSMVQGVITNPEGGLATAMTLLPFSSPIILPIRLSLTTVPDGEWIASLVILLVCSVGATYLASRLYRTGVLMYGKRPSLREAWRWVRTK
jgi:ABC-2 type transport system permease protein